MAEISGLRQLARKHGWDPELLEESVEEVGGSPDQLLGCGQIGCAVVGPDQTVLKITTDQGESDLWLRMVEMEESQHRTPRGVPHVFEVGTFDLGGAPAYFIVREAVEPLVIGREMNPSPRTRRYLFGALGERLPKSLTMEKDWSFENLARDLSSQYRITQKMVRDCRRFDEDLRVIYDLTDVTAIAAGERRGLQKKVWVPTYVEMALSLRPPFTGIGAMVASILETTGSTWVTDLHMGNLGWRMTPRPQVLAFDWLTAEFVPNGKIV